MERERPPKAHGRKPIRKTLGTGYGKKLTPEQREKAIKNLKPIQKGEVRNPWGREKGSVSLTAGLRRMLEEELLWPDPRYVPKPVKKGQKPEEHPMVLMKIRDLINMGLLKNAVRGELPSIESVYRKIDGTPDQKIDVNMNTSMEEDEDILGLLEEDEE